MHESQGTINDCSGCGVAMDVSAYAPFSRVICPNCHTETRVMCEFGPYTLVRRHAAGGMSMVFAAHDRTLNREVALKILSETYSADVKRIDAFESEARITASFSHPNVVRVFTTGRAFGRFYIAMEMVTGGHLEHMIREQGKIPELEMLPLAIEVAHGLQSAQAAGLIHRDVKPGNILLDAAGNVKLVDFGLALVTQGGKAQATEIWATPYYVPPETVDGREEDFRSDIYAFGATLYHALSGKPSCDEESMATDLLREAKKKVLPLSAVDPSISKGTCRVVDRAMAYDPADRYGSYGELIAELTAALDQLASGHGDFHRPAARGRRLWAAAAAAMLLFTVPLAIWLGKKRAEPAPASTPHVSEPVRVPDGVDHSAEIARSYRAARAAMSAGDFPTAEREFGALHDNPQAQEPTRSWTGVEAVLAAYLDGRAEDATRRARQLRAHLQSLPPSHPLAGSQWDFLLESLESLTPLEASENSAPASTLAAAMLAGLKNWDQGLINKAADCFNAVRAVELPQEEAWASIYQKIAADFLHDHAIISGPAFTAQPADRAACQRLIEQLEQVLPTLKTTGRARFNVSAWQTDLKRLAVHHARAKTPSPPRGTPPAEVHAKLAEFAAELRFAEFTTWLKQLPDSAPDLSRKSLLTMAEAGTSFLTDMRQDLSQEPFYGESVLKDGTSVARVSIEPDGAVSVLLASGETRSCSWTEFPPDVLLAMHRGLAAHPASEMERLRRHECAIAFDWLVGNRARALDDAAKLCSASLAFNQRWSEISAGLPQ